MSADLKLITAGESHGPGLTCIVEGRPLARDRDAFAPVSYTHLTLPTN